MKIKADFEGKMVRIWSRGEKDLLENKAGAFLLAASAAQLWWDTTPKLGRVRDAEGNWKFESRKRGKGGLEFGAGPSQGAGKGSSRGEMQGKREAEKSVEEAESRRTESQ